jgi:hypothetical protein
MIDRRVILFMCIEIKSQISRVKNSELFLLADNQEFKKSSNSSKNPPKFYFVFFIIPF